MKRKLNRNEIDASLRELKREAEIMYQLKNPQVKAIKVIYGKQSVSYWNRTVNGYKREGGAFPESTMEQVFEMANDAEIEIEFITDIRNIPEYMW